jgi:hypothetical protein
MDLTDTDLPDDIDALKALVRAHAASAHANAQRVVELQDQLSSRVIEIEHLKLTIGKHPISTVADDVDTREAGLLANGIDACGGGQQRSNVPR